MLGGVKRLRLIASGALLLLLVLGCMCGGPEEPPRPDCDDPAAMATIDGLELRARYEVGGQGASMLMMDVTYLGTGAPECATLAWEVRDPTDGSVMASGTEGLTTNEVLDGRATREPFWMFWEFGSRVELVVQAYGQTASAEICEFGSCADSGT